MRLLDHFFCTAGDNTGDKEDFAVVWQPKPRQLQLFTKCVKVQSLKHCMCGLNGKQVLLAIFRFISVLIVQSDRMWIYTDQNLEVKKKVLNSYK